MFIAIGRNLIIVFMTIVIVGVSTAVWPIDSLRPERRLEDAGARLAYAYDGTLLVGASLEGSNFGDDQVSVAARVSSLQRLSLAESFVTECGIRSLQPLSRLVCLNLRRTCDTWKAIDEIAQLSSLAELSLEECDWLRDEHLAQLSTMPNLQLLNLSGTRITPLSFEQLSRFPKLQCLMLNHCSQIDDDAVDSLIQLCLQRPLRLNLSGTDVTRQGLARLRASLPDLYIDLRPETMVGLRDVGERGQFMTDPKGEIIGFRYRRDPDGFIAELQSGDITAVSALPGIKRLYMEFTNISDEMLLKSNRMPHLEILRLSSTLVSDVGLQALERFPNLTTLLMANADVIGHGLENLRHVPRLQTLKIQTELGDEILPYITQLSDLRALSVNAPLTDAGVEQLSSLQKLQSLELIRTRIRGPGIEKLIRLPELSELVFEGGPLNDTDIDPLSRFKTVNQIVLARTQVTRVGKNRLVSMAPNLGVFWTDAEASPRESFR